MIATFLVYYHWNFQRHSLMDFHICEFWCSWAKWAAKTKPKLMLIAPMGPLVAFAIMSGTFAASV